MQKKEKNEELQSRREFFKKAAKGALPILALTVVGPAVLSSCTKEDDDDENGGCGNSCAGSCQKSCSGSCDSGCMDHCNNSCDYKAWD